MVNVHTVLSVVVALLLSGNNLAVCVGPAVGSGVIKERDAIMLACVMFSVGLLLGGLKFRYYMTLNPLIPSIALCSALIVLMLGETLKIPMSLVYVTTTTTLTLAALTGSVTAVAHLVTCIAYWLAVVPLSIASSLLAALLLLRALRRRPMTGYRLTRPLVALLTFLLCLTFGENNLGFLWALGGGLMSALPLYLCSIVCGVLLLGRSTLRKMISIYALSPLSALTAIAVATLITSLATELGIPVSFSVVTICSLFGVSYAYRVRLINYRYISHALLWTYVTIPLTALVTMATYNVLKLLQYV